MSVVCVLALIASVTPVRASAQAAAGTLSGTVQDASSHPLSDAIVVTAGPASETAITGADGAFSIALPPGAYAVSAQRSGFETTTKDAAVEAGKTTSLVIVMPAAKAAAPQRVTLGTEATLNHSAQSISALPSSALSERFSPNLNALVREIPGVTISRGIGSTPDASYAVRGGFIETLTQIDGHPLSPGSFGRWNSEYASSALFESIQVVKGAGLSGANAGQSAFGTVNLRTRSFTSSDQAQFVLGADSYAGQYSIFAISGNLGSDNRFSYLFDKNVSGQRGASDNQLGFNALPGKNNTAVIAYEGDLTSRFVLNSELMKLRYRFNASTSLYAGFLGIQGDFLGQGASYGTYLGMRTVAPYLDTPGGRQYNAPYAQNLIGQTIPAYQWFPDSFVQTNEPFFEAELRTTFHQDSISLRPYTGVVSKSIDGNRRAYQTNGATGSAWLQVTDPTQCSNAAPCYQGKDPNPVASAISSCSSATPCYTPNFASPYVLQELDRLHGLTFSYVHPIGDNFINFAYDYHSDSTSSIDGDPTPALNVNQTIETQGLQVRVAPTVARTSAFSLVGQFGFGQKTKLALGGYLTQWSLNYSAEDPAIVLALGPGAGNNIPLVLIQRTRTKTHFDPHVGLSYAAGNNLALRASAGSSITFPYAILVSGAPNVTTSLGYDPNGTLYIPNPDLNPESTIAYDLGFDFKGRGSQVLSFDLFRNETHNIFIETVNSTIGPLNPISGVPAYTTSTMTINGPEQVNFGAELSLSRIPSQGFGYRVTGTLQRAYLQHLPLSLYATTPSPLINYKQLDGDQMVPYGQAYADVEYGLRKGARVNFGALWEGANNQTHGPGFVLYDAGVRVPLRRGLSGQVSVDNLFNYSSGNTIAQGISGAGFASTTLGPPPKGFTGTAFGSLPEVRQTIQPRTFRFQLQQNFGR